MSQPPFGPPPGGPSQPDGPAPQDDGSASYGLPAPQQPGWQQVPPEQLSRMHQPGIVPLRPLTLGDIFGGSLQTMRRNPEATIGMGLIVLTVMLVPSLVLSLVVTRTLVQASEVDLGVITLLINTGFAMLSSIALTGMIVHVVGEAVLGDRASLSETWRTVRGRLPALVGTVLLMSVLFAVFVVAIVLVLTLIAISLDSAAGGVAAGLGIVVLVVGAVALLLWAGFRLSLAPAAVVLEQVGPWRGIARAWSLTTGGTAFRVLGITLLAGIVTGIFSTVVQLPVLGVMTLAIESAGLSASPVSPTVLAVDHLVQLIVGAVTIPFTAGVTALLYLDLRIRREGLDVSLARAATDRAVARNS